MGGYRDQIVTRLHSVICCLCIYCLRMACGHNPYFKELAVKCTVTHMCMFIIIMYTHESINSIIQSQTEI